jgi:hypothetical protein
MTDPLRAFHGHIGAPQYIYLPREDRGGLVSTSGPAPDAGRVY